MNNNKSLKFMTKTFSSEISFTLLIFYLILLLQLLYYTITRLWEKAPKIFWQLNIFSFLNRIKNNKASFCESKISFKNTERYINNSKH